MSTRKSDSTSPPSTSRVDVHDRRREVTADIGVSQVKRFMKEKRLVEMQKTATHKIFGSLSNVVEKYYRKILGCLCSTALPCFVIEHIEDAATEVFKVPKSVADTL